MERDLATIHRLIQESGLKSSEEMDAYLKLLTVTGLPKLDLRIPLEEAQEIVKAFNLFDSRGDGVMKAMILT